jgi:hypothetical protein
MTQKRRNCGAFCLRRTQAARILQVFEPLRLIGGVSYDHIRYPENTDLPPISDKETSRELVAPKGGLLFQPWKRGFLRADYSQSLGGLFFDNSVRLEPSQIAGFNQAFRSLIPESVAGLVPGTKFETAGVGFDQSFSSGTWLGAEAEWLTSDGRRTVGAPTNSLPAFLNIPDSSSSTTQTLDFRERDLSAYAAQLLGKWFSLTARYRLSEANLNESFPDITDTAVGLNHLEANNRALLNQVGLGANFYHPSGFFANGKLIGMTRETVVTVRLWPIQISGSTTSLSATGSHVVTPKSASAS